jgi:gluconate 2-dehydrogenase gamma chain
VTNQPLDRSTDPRSIDRRQLLRNTSIAAGGVAIAGISLPDLAGAAPVTPSKPVIKLHQTASPVASPAAIAVDLENYAPVALTDAELVTLKAATDRIIPADDLGPSASEAGVFVYIDRALSSRYAAQLPLYQESLLALDVVAEGGNFAALDAESQDALLSDIESGEIKEFPAGFFMTLLTHTREGLFADPIYGGNQNFSGWDLIGYTGIRLLWTAEDQAIDYLPEPEHISVAEYGGEA